MRMRRQRVVTGVEGMIGDIAEVIEDFTGSGHVFVNGERWNAHSQVAVRDGQSVRIVAVDGLNLVVEPIGAAVEA